MKDKWSRDPEFLRPRPSQADRTLCTRREPSFRETDPLDQLIEDIEREKDERRGRIPLGNGVSMAIDWREFEEAE